MRKALNDNPLVQVGILAVLALLVGFLLLTRMSHKSSDSSTGTTTAAASAASVATPGSSSSTDTSTTAPSTAAPDATAAPTPTSPSAAPGAATGASTGRFVAGPGLPEPVVRAYKDNEVVALLVVRRHGIDDEAVKAGAEAVGRVPKVALFVTNAGHIARYSRIATGVDVDRVPALIVLRQRKLTEGGVPEATVSYGFRGVDSVAQAVRDAVYKGPTNEPYYPK